MAAGTEVLWRDPHFQRVWFPPGADAPRVEAAEIVFSDRPGRSPQEIEDQVTYPHVVALTLGYQFK